MKTITVSAAFGSAPPRSAAVLCLQGAGGCTDLMLCDWFTWLNIKRNPMISFSLPRKAPMAAALREGDSFVLAVPRLSEAKLYKQAVSVKGDWESPETDESEADGAELGSNQEPETVAVKGLSVRIPRGSEVLLRGTVAGAYNYPFKKVRIFNCNLEEALGNEKNMLD